MFCDLVDSTALSERLDPEDLRGVLHAYRTHCGDVIALRRICRPLHRRRYPDLFRLAERARGRRRTRCAGGPGDCADHQASLRHRGPVRPYRHRHRTGRRRRTGRHGARVEAGGGQHAESGGAAANADGADSPAGVSGPLVRAGPCRHADAVQADPAGECRDGLRHHRRQIPARGAARSDTALVQDTAYDSLLKRRRQELHAKIARAIEQNVPNGRIAEPERRSIGRGGSGRNPGSCGRRSALLGCGRPGAGGGTRMRCWPRSTGGSRKGLTGGISGRRSRCLLSWGRRR